MSLSLVTAPASEPITLADAKLHLRVTADDDNSYIDSLIRAARETCETFTHRAFVSQTWDLKLDGFPDCDVLCLPKPPLQSVTSVSYVDTNGDTQTWTSTNYLVDAPAGLWASKGRLALAYGVIWPITREQINAVTVRFVAGYGAAAAVPFSVGAAMKLLIGNWYRNRESVAQVPTQIQILPDGVDRLLWPLKAF